LIINNYPEVLIVMKRLVIFDLDGTLVDTLADLAASMNYALGLCGYPLHEMDAYRLFVGNGVLKLFERALPEGEQTEVNVERVRGLFMGHYDGHLTDRSVPYAGMRELVECLVREGYKVAVASNKYQSATEEIVRELFPDVPFWPVFGQREGVPRKPDPQVVEEILELTGVARGEALYVGDSAVDMQTGVNARVCTCGVTWGFRSRTELEAYNPKYIASTPQEVYGAILNENR
jgi:phosphoglycolate phosphatase